MPHETLLAFLVAVVFAAVHMTGQRLAFLRTMPRSAWLSLAGGVSVAYVFIHVLPELAARQEAFQATWAGRPGPLEAIERHSYLIALFGLAVFYGLDHAVRASARVQHRAGGGRRPGRGAFWLHLGAFAVYNVLIGYLLLHREEPGLRDFAIYAVAMGLHFVVNDQGLREHHGAAYDVHGRWILAAAPLLGWGLGAVTEIPELAVTALFAVLAGGVVLNVLKEELPEERESRFWAFALGTGGYAALLLATG